MFSHPTNWPTLIYTMNHWSIGFFFCDECSSYWVLYCLFDENSLSRSPFDLKHPLGYLLGVATQYIIFLITFLMTACAVSMGFGVYLLFMAMCEDINNNLDTLNRLLNTQKNPARISKQFSDLIHLHSNVKQLSEHQQTKHWSYHSQTLNFLCLQIGCWLFYCTPAHCSAYDLQLHRNDLFVNVNDQQRASSVTVQTCFSFQRHLFLISFP